MNTSFGFVVGCSSSKNDDPRQSLVDLPGAAIQPRSEGVGPPGTSKRLPRKVPA